MKYLAHLSAAIIATWLQTSTVAQEAKDMTSAKPKSALLIIDAQVGVLGSVWDSKRVMANIESLVSKARTSHTPVLWVQHSDQEELKVGSSAWQLMPNFKPDPADPIIHKKYNSAFAETDLDTQLKQLGVKRLVLAGGLTNWCIRSTAYSAMDRGYDLVIASDAHSTENLEPRPGQVIAAKDIIDEFNSVMRWVSAPHVRTEVKNTAEVAY